jgi:hypothetical protein
MKKIFGIIVLFVPSIAFSQFTRGQLFLEGSLSTLLQNSDYHAYGNVSYLTDNIKNNSISVSPAIGFFLSPKNSVGASLGYNFSSHVVDYANTQTSKSTGKSFLFAPFVRHYFPLSNFAYFSLQGQVTFSRGTNTISSTGNTLEMPIYTLGANISPSFIFFPSNKWGIEASVGSLGYSYLRYLPDVSSTGQFFINTGSFSFGVAYYFAKKE